MSPPDEAAVTDLLTKGPHRSEVGRKQLTLAFGGFYVASTTLSAPPALVWETEKGYPRYYIPTESLHEDVKRHLADPESHDGKLNGHASAKSRVDVTRIKTVNSKGDVARAVIEKLTIGSKSTTWVRFVEGEWKGFIRFERNEIGELHVSSVSNLLLISGNA